MKNGSWVSAMLVTQPSEWSPEIDDVSEIVLTLDQDMKPYQLTGRNVVTVVMPSTMPKGTPPDWERREFASGYGAYSKVHKMYYGTYNSKLKNSSGENKGTVMLALTSNGNSNSIPILRITLSSSSDGFSTMTLPTFVMGFYYGGRMTDCYYYNTYLYVTTGTCLLKYRGYATSGSTTACTPASSPFDYSIGIAWNSLCYSSLLGKLYVFSAEGYVAEANNGASTVSIGVRVNDSSAAWSPDAQVFCVCGADGTATSFDGVTWATHTGNDVPKDLIDLTYRGDLQTFFARSIDEKIFYASGDGETWHAVNGTPIPLDTVAAVEYSAETGLYCAVGGIGKYAYFSDDLETWTPTTISNTEIEAGSVIYLSSITDGTTTYPGLYVLMPTSGDYFYTFDPLSWTDEEAL